MKCQVPQIRWHNRDPVLSIDFQPGKRNILRLASGGTDSHVVIWYITYQENKSIKVECASDLHRHSKPVNVVRFSPDGELLASGDDEGAMFVWQLKERAESPKQEIQDATNDEEQNKEEWFPLKLLRGHLEDIYDISWSADGNLLVSASMDNTCIIWDMQKFQKVHILSDSKGYVQGVSWDPLNTYIASLSSDRALRIYNINTKKTVRVQRAPWTVKTEKGTNKSRLFYDDTLKSYFRRLTFTPDGELLIAPSGILERDEEKFQNTTYIFSRHSPNKPVIQLPTGDKYTIAVRCNPFLYKLRGSNKENCENHPKTKPMIDLPYRMIFAVAACESILLYDTEQLLPFAYVSNILYTHLTDLAWSPDGKILVASSTDGYCALLGFGDDELGEIYISPAEEVVTEPATANKVSSTDKAAPSATILTEKIAPANATADNSAEKTERLSVPVIATDTSAASPKISEGPVDSAKLNKKPKVTIMNFFSSPKLKPASNSDATIVNKNVTKQKNEEAKETTSTNSSTIKDIQPMEIEDDDSVQLIHEIKSTGAKDNSEIKSAGANDNSVKLVGEIKNNGPAKKKVKNVLRVFAETRPNRPLDIAGGKPFVPTKLTIDIPFEQTVEIKENAEKSNIDDWKLELSQDAEPMEVTEPMPSTSSSSPKTPATSTTPKSVDQKSKRRISLITLSTKTSLK